MIARRPIPCLWCGRSLGPAFGQFVELRVIRCLCGIRYSADLLRAEGFWRLPFDRILARDGFEVTRSGDALVIRDVREPPPSPQDIADALARAGFRVKGNGSRL